MSWVTSIRQQVADGASVIDIRQSIADAIAAGVGRPEVSSELNKLRCELSGSGDARGDDIVLEIMDFLVGWCSPAMRL